MNICLADYTSASVLSLKCPHCGEVVYLLLVLPFFLPTNARHASKRFPVDSDMGNPMPPVRLCSRISRLAIKSRLDCSIAGLI